MLCFTTREKVSPFSFLVGIIAVVEPKCIPRLFHISGIFMRHATSFLLHFRTATLLYKEKEVLEKTTGMQKNNRIERGKKASNFQLLECVFLLFCARTTAKIEIRKSCRSFNVLSEFHFLFHSFLHSVQKISNTSCFSTETRQF